MNFVDGFERIVDDFIFYGGMGHGGQGYLSVSILEASKSTLESSRWFLMSMMIGFRFSVRFPIVKADPIKM